MNESNKVNLEVIPFKEMVPWESASEMDFLIRITALAIQIEKDRPQLNLGLVLDRSGSMSGQKIKKAKDAACYCVDQLMETDRISITIFDNTVEVIVPSSEAQERRKIKEAIRKINSGGTTALHAAWVTGAKQVAECVNRQCLNRVLLVTDGLANEGVTDPGVIVAQARELYERSISTTTIGIGNDFNEDLLVAMAKGAGGNSWFVEGPEDFQRIFETEMEGLVRETCANVSMKIEPAQGVEILDVLNDFERTPDGSYSLPALIAGDPLDVVVRMKSPGGAPGRFRCFGLSIQWSEHGSGKRHSMACSASITFAREQEAAAQAPNREVEKAVVFLEGARMKRRAMEYMDRGDFAPAEGLFRDHLERLGRIAAQTGDLSINAERQEILSLSRSIEERKDLPYVRKAMSYQTTYVQRGRSEKKRPLDSESK